MAYQRYRHLRRGATLALLQNQYLVRWAAFGASATPDSIVGALVGGSNDLAFAYQDADAWINAAEETIWAEFRNFLETEPFFLPALGIASTIYGVKHRSS